MLAFRTISAATLSFVAQLAAAGPAQGKILNSPTMEPGVLGSDADTIGM